MSLNVRWSESAIALSDDEFAKSAESVAFYMMFCGIQKITEENVREFAFRWQMWDVAIGGDTFRKLEERIEILTPFIGTSANVTPKTLHTFLTGDIKRIAKEKF